MATTPRGQQAQFIQRRLARRAGASSITRLADQYQGQIQDLTTQYETEFSRYQQRVNELMQPYEEAMKRYNEVELPRFDAYLQSYNQYIDRLSAYQPFVTESARTQQRVYQEFVNFPAAEYTMVDWGGWQRGDYNWSTGTYGDYRYVPPRYEWVTPPPRWENRTATDFVVGGKTLTQADFDKLLDQREGFIEAESGSNLTLMLRNLEPKPTFTQERPPEPVAPTAPKIDEFDTGQFDQRRAQLQEGFQREVAERKGARLNAVRRSSRTMLSGAQ